MSMFFNKNKFYSLIGPKGKTYEQVANAVTLNNMVYVSISKIEESLNNRSYPIKSHEGCLGEEEEEDMDIVPIELPTLSINETLSLASWIDSSTEELLKRVVRGKVAVVIDKDPEFKGQGYLEFSPRVISPESELFEEAFRNIKAQYEDSGLL